MIDLKLEEIEISGLLDKDGDCRVWIYDRTAYLSKEEMQQVIDHLTELLKL